MPVLTYVPGHMGGSETYARALVAGLDARSDIDLTVLTSNFGAGGLGARREIVVEGLNGGPATRDRLVTLARGLRPDRDARAALEGADVVHHPFTVPVPIARGPRVQSLLDVQHRDLPQLFSRAERMYRSVAYDRSAKRARRVITLSHFCKDRIVAEVGVVPERIDVVHLGVGREFFAESRAGERKPFVFYPAAAWPHKNHGTLLMAMEIVRRSRPDVRLVLTGGRANALGALPEWVEHRGRVSDAEVRDLYRTASCLAFPSLYEGFGLPPLEAMASGCPVAAATSGSLPEVCGDAAIMFDPQDIGSVAAAILSAMDAGDRLSDAGTARAQAFTWEACVDAHVRSFVACASQSRA